VRKEPLTAREKRTIDTKYRDRVRMMQSVNDMLGKVLGSMTAAQRANTYVVFSSDNGFHLGQHRLLSGKGTAYDHDVQVPLVITGPGVKTQTVNRIAQNVDLFPTFLRMAGINPPNDRDGASLLGLAEGDQPQQWRKSALVEHQRVTSPADPDAEPDAANATPPTYTAIRTDDALFVRYASGTTEYYDLATDAEQNTNKPNAAPDWIGPELRRLAQCGKAGQPTCWAESSDTRS
jgi:N-acetylglucosamine-6-sulfatase